MQKENVAVCAADLLFFLYRLVYKTHVKHEEMK